MAVSSFYEFMACVCTWLCIETLYGAVDNKQCITREEQVGSSHRSLCRQFTIVGESGKCCKALSQVRGLEKCSEKASSSPFSLTTISNPTCQLERKLHCKLCVWCNAVEPTLFLVKGHFLGWRWNVTLVTEINATLQFFTSLLFSSRHREAPHLCWRTWPSFQGSLSLIIDG